MWFTLYSLLYLDWVAIGYWIVYVYWWVVGLVLLFFRVVGLYFSFVIVLLLARFLVSFTYWWVAGFY